MIVDPDFVDHWKTRLLVGSLDGDESAPMYVLRIWAHCQNRRQWQFDNLTHEALKALCRFPGHSNKLEASLVASGFIRREGKMLIVCNWDEYNRSLIAAWSNGGRGGRPPGKQAEKPQQTTNGEPNENPNETQGKPTGSRVEESREDEIDVNRKKKRQVFVKPELAEVEQYFSANQIHGTASEFFDYYESNGWKVGKGPMKNWQASARNWGRNQIKFGKTSPDLFGTLRQFQAGG